MVTSTKAPNAAITKPVKTRPSQKPKPDAKTAPKPPAVSAALSPALTL